MPQSTNRRTKAPAQSTAQAHNRDLASAQAGNQRARLLARYRSEAHDEGEEQEFITWTMATQRVTLSALLVLIAYDYLVLHRSVDGMLAVITLGVAAGFYQHYRRSGERWPLGVAIVMLLGAVFMAVQYVAG